MSSNQTSAALTGALLANKGAAAPSGSVSSFLDEFPTKKPFAEEPQVPDMRTVHVAPERPLEKTPPRIVNEAPPLKPTAPRAKLSVRLDSERHLRLKLAAAHLQRSSQTIMLEALDAYLAEAAPAIGGNCVCLNDDG